MKLGYFTSKKIDKLAEKGNDLLTKNMPIQAIEKYKQIIKLLPSPVEQWEAYEWAVVSIADTYYVMGEYEQSEIYFREVVNNSSNPFILLRYGQVNHYLGNKDASSYYLCQAFFEDKNIFDQEEKFLEIVKKNYKKYEKMRNEKFKDMFRLPAEYKYLEKELGGIQWLWDPINWDEINIQYTILFSQIPQKLYDNDISFFCVSAILESSIRINKLDELSKWLKYLEITSRPRKDKAVVEVWKGICELKLGNEKEAMEYFSRVVENGDERLLKNFRHFGNEIYKYYCIQTIK